MKRSNKSAIQRTRTTALNGYISKGAEMTMYYIIGPSAQEWGHPADQGERGGQLAKLNRIKRLNDWPGILWKIGERIPQSFAYALQPARRNNWKIGGTLQKIVFGDIIMVLWIFRWFCRKNFDIMPPIQQAAAA